MKKYLTVVILFLLVVANLLVLTPQLYIHSQQTVAGLILGIIGFILAIFNYKKGYKTYQKIGFILGGIINIYPVLYFTFLFFALG
ncbi:hypothetical protein SOQ50_001850 [Enterococcus faecalis]|nr:hypothetical protein [Enterococcus faecalis]ELY8285491.1 hypothetical protein [Enterococcus faecalis]